MPLDTIKRTFEAIRELLQKWIKDTGGVGKKAKDLVGKYFSCTHEPVYTGNGEVMDKFSFNPLHVLIGNINRIVQLLKEVYPELEAWLESKSLVRQAQNGDFNGNDCK